MWTKKATQLSVSELPQAHQNFMARNPGFTAHHQASTERVANALRRYAASGKIEAENICKLVIKMTSSCNLRCEQCFQWRETGFHHGLDPTAIPYEQSGHLFDFVERQRCDIILTGGEPTLHPDFPKFLSRLAEAGCFIYICTNGLMIKRHFEELSKYHDQLAFLISIDGPKDIHDSIRGKGTYNKTMAGIKLLADGKKAGKQWLIGVENTMMAKNLDRATELLNECEQAGVDWMIYNHLWVVDMMARSEYHRFCEDYDTVPNSYTGFDMGDFRPDYIEQVIDTIEKLRAYPAQIPVLFGPDYDADEIRQYYRGKMPARPHYLKMGVKLDVDIGGKLVMTKQFPDLVFGNVLETPIEELIASEPYQRAAETMRQKSLKVLNACPDAHNFLL
ncbi:radical SAM protein [Pseudoalteromonas rubra]|uniref:AstB/chuR/nirj n=1 Tax=Pseudoalteromonas rubra TaxID=43658 RepID=A0A0F4QEF9_9GAMM|nr:radical SAM protein [Pseudoalteromonas rubra]KJZ05639.1 AstB/chuR/nirj [Pseudoalteromonas rubra]